MLSVCSKAVAISPSLDTCSYARHPMHGGAAARLDRQAPDHGREDVGVGALGGDRADLFVIEACDEADGRIRVEARRLGRLDESLDGAVRHVEVVEDRAEKASSSLFRPPRHAFWVS